MNINAYYDRIADSHDDVAVSLDLIFNELDDLVTFDTTGINTLIARVTDAIVHEMIHQTQHRARDFIEGKRGKSVSYDPRLKAAQEYLSRPDEIEAYAHNIASELLRTLDFDAALEYMRQYRNAAALRNDHGNFLSPNLYGIMATFDFDTSNPSIKQLATTVVKYLDILHNE